MENKKKELKEIRELFSKEWLKSEGIPLIEEYYIKI